MKRKILLLLAAVVLATAPSLACTNLIVGKKASTDGSVIVSYNADSFGMYGFLYHSPAATHQPGEMLKVYEWDTGKYMGEIAQAEQTYLVNGNINEFQVTIGETTFGGRECLVDTTAVVDYGSLIYIALQRSRSAKEALKVMTDLVKEYGYASEGETFTVADPNEAWILEMVGKGPGVRGALWVAVRVPDDCIAAHANQSRIHQFNMDDKENCLYSPDVVSYAREKGYFNGMNKDFSFADAYCPADFGALRFCEARVWGFYRHYNKEMDAYLSYIKGETKEPMPLFIKPDRKLSVQDIQNGMRDHYEGTELDLTKDMGAGPYESPYRPSPLSFEVDSVKCFNERPISTQQTGFTFVAQMRSTLPNAIGGVLWFGVDDANMVAYTPVYCCNTKVPACYSGKNGDCVTFSWDSAFWIYNWVANMIYPRYSLMIDDMRKVQNRLELKYHTDQQEIEAKALAMNETNPAQAKEFLTNYTDETATSAFKEWKQLGEYLVVKYNDLVIKREKDGKMQHSETGLCPPVIRPGYPVKFQREMLKQTGDRFVEKTLK